MKRKGFTLIEFLAVIVVLAIIVLIAVPTVIDVVEKARQGAVKSSTLRYVDAIEKKVVLSEFSNIKYEDKDDYVYDEIEVDIKGEVPTGGKYALKNGKVTTAIFCINGYEVGYASNNAEVYGKCTGDDLKLSGSVKLSSNNGFYIYPTEQTIEVIENLSEGALSCESDDEEVATCKIEGTTVTVVPGEKEGSATLTIKSAGTSKYREAQASYIVFTELGTLSVTANGYSGIYDGEPHGITVTSSDATIMYGDTEGSYTLTSSPTYIEAGTYTVYYQVTKSGYQTVEGSKTVMITKSPDGYWYPTGNYEYGYLNSNCEYIEDSNSLWKVTKTFTLEAGTYEIFGYSGETPRACIYSSSSGTGTVEVETAAAYQTTNGAIVQLNETGYLRFSVLVSNGIDSYYVKKIDDNATIVTFDATGGTIDKNYKIITGETYEELPTPTRDGYEFLGWYTSETDGEEVTSESMLTTTDNHTLYASWKVEKTYIFNNGQVSTLTTYAPSSSYTFISIGTSVYQYLNIPEDAGWYVTSYARTNAQIDVTQYSTMYITYSSSTGGSTAGLSTSTSSINTKSISLSKSSSKTTKSIDISSLSGSYYIYPVYSSQTYAGQDVRCYVYEIWFE